jgi:hypothetical protein
MKFNTLGKAVRELQALGLDDLDIAIIYHVNVGAYTTVGDIVLECGDVASPATIHTRLTKKLVKAKILQLVHSEEDGRTKYVELGSKFEKLSELIGGI